MTMLIETDSPIGGPRRGSPGDGRETSDELAAKAAARKAAHAEEMRLYLPIGDDLMPA